MVGVSIAWHLLQRGREVMLIDRRAPGHETSFGNAGLIQREAVEPHPFPRDLASILRVLPNHSIDIRYRTGAMVTEAHPLWEYWRYSAPKPFARIVREYASLIEHSTSEHEKMFTAAGAEHLIRRDGWLELFRNPDPFEAEIDHAQDISEKFGVTFKRIDQARLQEMEPCLTDTAIGAVHWTNSWSVTDPGGLVQAYADNFSARGGTFEKAEACKIVSERDGWRLETDQGSYSADELVLATGPWSQNWLEGLGYALPMFVMRGYHMHYEATEKAYLNRGIMDFENGYLLTPKKAGLRLTTGAELNTLDAPPRYGQLDAAEAAIKDLFALGRRKEDKPWKGNRPCFPDMKPVIGPAHRHANLWFAFGHGHQGFTLGPTTGRLLGEMMDGEQPLVDMAPFRSDRF